MKLNQTRNRLILSLIAFGLLAIATGYSAEPDYFVAPGKKSVMLIGRIVVRDSLNIPFYAKSFNVDPSQPHTFTMGTEYIRYKNLGWIEKRRYTFANGDFFFQTKELDKSRTDGIDSIRFDFWSSDKTSIYLPLSVGLTVPLGVRFLYIGSFYYTVGNNFAVTVKNVDEFDQVQELLKTIVPDAEIQRAVLQDLNDEPSSEPKK